MRKLRLISFLMFFGIQSANAFSCASDVGKSSETTGEPNGFGVIFFIMSFALVICNIVFYFLRERKGLWTVIISSVAFIFSIPVIILILLAYSECGDGSQLSFVLKTEFALMLFLLTFQVSSFIFNPSSKRNFLFK